MSITIVLPYPVSANVMWRTYMPKGFKAPVTVVSAEGKAHKAAVAAVCRQHVLGPIPGRVALDIQLFPHRPLDWAKRARKAPLTWDDDVRCIDLDNANKVLLDALKGVAIDDDRWVRRLTSERMEPDGEARVVVTITALSAPASPQPELLTKDLIDEAEVAF